VLHQLSIPQAATSSTPKAEISLRLTHTPEIEYQSALLTAELEEPTDPSSSDSDSDSDTDSMAGDKETKMNPPPEFSRSAEKARDFLQQVDLYITCKKDQFKDNTARIAWTLSFIRGGPGGSGRQIHRHTYCRPRSKLYNYTPNMGTVQNQLRQQVLPEE